MRVLAGSFADVEKAAASLRSAAELATSENYELREQLQQLVESHRDIQHALVGAKADSDTARAALDVQTKASEAEQRRLQDAIDELQRQAEADGKDRQKVLGSKAELDTKVGQHAAYPLLA